jgi:tetratricopeptide (TPR) repeat protein
VFNYAVKFGEREIPAGKYALFMIPEKDKWIVILNRDWNQWGAYNYNAQDDVIRIAINPQKINHTEMCTYTFTEVSKSQGVLSMEWGNTRISIKISTNTHQQTLDQITKTVSAYRENWYAYSAAAQYHFYERNEAEKAMEYIDIAIALDAPNPAPWMLKSQILASQNDYKAAIKMAKIAIVVSKKNNFLFEIEENEEHINKWKNL